MIKSMHLTNIQSWKDETIEFSDNLVNVVSARSEKGKTVLFKVFYQMVFPNYYKFGSRNDLIRRTCTYGEVEFELYNFTKILFHCEHKEQWFKMKRPCDDDWKVYRQSNCPNEIINELGLVVDYELQYILNIYIKDNQYPFINTTKTWNAVLFNQVFKNEKLDKVIEKLSSESKELSELSKRLSTQINYKRLQSKQLVYRDIEKLRQQKDVIAQLNECYDVVDEIYKVTSKYESHLATHESVKDKVFDVVDIMDIKKLYLSLQTTEKITKELESHLNVVENIPDNVDLNLKVSGLRTTYVEVQSVLKKSEQMESQLINYGSILQKSEKISEISSVVVQIKDLMLVLEELQLSLNNFDSKMLEQANICNKIKDVSSELEEVKSKIEICPTCKRPL